MNRRRANSPTISKAPSGATAYAIAAGRDWRVAEYVCTSGPQDRAFEERRAWATVAVVAEGTFTYRCDTGKALLYPGALLLGNPGTCYECGHEHSFGDRCFAFHYAPDLLSEVAASVGGGSGFRFRQAMLPADDVSWSAAIDVAVRPSDPLRADEAITEFLERAVARSSGAAAKPLRLSAADTRRIMLAVRRIEDEASGHVTLDTLAAGASMSKYHFLRCFRRALGITPYQLLLDIRLRRAAVALLSTRERVSAIAYDAGFADLSTFNNRFRVRFGESPSRFRRRGA